ncbi:MAG: branched-chain amino acid ABC transporter substrate-binding protein [Burkholderiales bacterium RIFCSPHIGHO2_12_FULL_69_20]|jgi:branched-chain amino acid transport system substrate-binding protein|nr:MAG: branched-chain amino acid ABC transporter substrate-binding protein [Burkholderiales bacterium RIFCSPHIGHO2_12_FULL_69_20]
MQRHTFLKLSAALATGMLLSTAVRAQTTINVAALADFAGPYANVMNDMQGGRLAVVEWWNKEVGEKLKVRIVVKTYDTRYDVAQTASLWPGIKAELKPALVLGLGGPDAAALQQRLPEDKVPMLFGTAAYGFGWKPNQWALNIRPTYPHEAAGFLEWFRSAKLENKRPVKVAIITSEATPAYADMAKGLQSYTKAHPDKATFVEAIWTEVQPTDLTLQVRRLANAGTDVIVIQTNTAQAVATKRALQALGKNIPIMLSLHNGVAGSSKTLGDPNGFAGDFEVGAIADASEDDTTARKFYRMLQDKHGLKSGWNAMTMLGLGQTIVAVRAIEAAVKAKGADKVTGEAVHAALLATQFSGPELMGLLPGVDFSVDAPFPTGSAKVNVATMKDGKVIRAAGDIAVPTVPKW